MKVVFIHNKKNSGGFSINKVFDSVGKEISKSGCEVIHYYLTSNRIYDILNLWKVRADIYHFTGDINHLVPLFFFKKTIVTIHDLGHYLYTLNGCKKIIYKWMYLLIPIKISKHIIAISNHTKNEIIGHLNVKKEWISVIENSVNCNYIFAENYFTPSPVRILQIGTSKHKNVSRLIESLEHLDVKLILIGKLSQDLIFELSKYKVKYDNLFNIDENELYNEYLKADIVSFVSTIEGFGMPIIEAQAVGRILITSDIDPHKSIAGDGAYFVNPYSVNSIRNGIMNLIESEELRKELIERGTRNVKKYDSSLIATKMLKYYNSIVN